MSEYIITKKQIEELNNAHGGMKIATSWLSSYAIWDTSNTYPVMKSEHVAINLPEIVRCCDCRHYDDEPDLESTEPRCWRDPNHRGTWEYTQPDGFCAWGKKVEGC